MSLYALCGCGSGKKIKFCCYELMKTSSESDLAQACLRFPLDVCIMGVDPQEMGLTAVVIARKVAEDHYVAAFYLLDIWCLGLKQVEFKKNMSRAQVEFLIAGVVHSFGAYDEIAYEHARGVILGSIDYARTFGFEPHPDWSYAQHFVEPKRAYTSPFAFGVNGKPLYMQGPYDENVNDKISAVVRAGGNWIAEV